MKTIETIKIKVLSLKKVVSKIDVQMANGSMNNYSPSPIGRKTQIKTRMRNRLTPVKTAILRETEGDRH